jgi:hypothetical protein
MFHAVDIASSTGSGPLAAHSATKGRIGLGLHTLAIHPGTLKARVRPFSAPHAKDALHRARVAVPAYPATGPKPEGADYKVVTVNGTDVYACAIPETTAFNVLMSDKRLKIAVGSSPVALRFSNGALLGGSPESSAKSNAQSSEEDALAERLEALEIERPQGGDRDQFLEKVARQMLHEHLAPSDMEGTSAKHLLSDRPFLKEEFVRWLQENQTGTCTSDELQRMVVAWAPALPQSTGGAGEAPAWERDPQASNWYYHDLDTEARVWAANPDTSSSENAPSPVRAESIDLEEAYWIWDDDAGNYFHRNPLTNEIVWYPRYFD